MTPAMIEQHNARVAQRRAEYGKGNPFSEPGKPIPAPASENPPVDRESKLHDQILAFCAGRWPRWVTIRCRMDKRSTIAVSAHDITIFLPNGGILCLECKAAKRKLTPEQQAWAKEMEMLGHCVYTVWSFADFESILRDKNLI